MFINYQNDYCNMAKIDSCTLIYLTKTDLLALARKVYSELRITNSVYEEVVTKGKKGGHADAYVIESEIEKKKIKLIHSDIEIPTRLVSLQKGEAETIVEAKNENTIALLDDIKSKILAENMGVKYTSIDLVLIESLLRGIINYDDFEKLASRVNKICGMRPDRYAELLYLGKIIHEVKK